MDRRVFLAVILIAVVIVVTPLFFPSARPRPGVYDSLGAETAVASDTMSSAATRSIPTRPADTYEAKQSVPASSAPTADSAVVVSDSAALSSAHMVAWYASEGGSPLRIVLTDYASRDTARPTGPVVLETTSRQPLLQYSLVEGNSTIPLSARTSRLQYDTTTHENGVLRYVGEVSGHRIDVSYTSPKSDSGRYVTRVQVHIDGVSTGAQLAVRLPSTLASMETDTADDIRHLAYGYRTASGDVSSVAFGKLDTASTRVTTGPLEWVALRNKYFLVAVVTLDSAISKASFRGEPHAGKLVPMAEGTIQLPLRDGRANFELYTGPQEFERLRAIGHGLDQVNPYAGWLHAVVQPFATAVTWVLLWMKRASGLSYGWVIIIFGILIRVILWPLYQSSMRTSIRMQRLQPELAEVQKKYKQDPRKQQEALVKLYQAHGMTPFSPMMGCLPMLLPMPILFALYFVFLNTIEFRGVSFLWMHDISAADPYYITPLVMGLSMFVLSWIGMRGTPPTTQTRMMSYMMPVVLTFMFFRFAAGLNLYYAVQNIAAIPQQWLLAQERAGAAAGGSGGGTRGRSKT